MTHDGAKPSSERILEIPLVLSGRVAASVDRPVHRVTYERDLAVTIPVLNPDDVAALTKERAAITASLEALSTDEITCYLAAAGERWMKKDPPLRQMADKNLSYVTGLPKSMLANDYETFGHILIGRYHTWEQIEAEFGSDRVFDEWIPKQMTWLKAFPRGMVLHYLVGNLPLAGLYSVLRGIISRNCTLAKLPARDPLSVSAFAQALIEVDAEHPIARSISIAYWRHEDDIGKLCVRAADAICVWGKSDVIEAIKKEVKVDVPIAEYGPRWSASVIDLNHCDPVDAALRTVEDVAYYDQEACFSTQFAYVHGDGDDFGIFRKALKEHFERFAERHERVTQSRDVLANRSFALLEARYMGLDVEEGVDWAIIIVNDDASQIDHPLARTLVIKPVAAISQVAEMLDKGTQTVSVFPWDLLTTYRDDWARAGADRFVALGWSRLPRAGWTHDGSYGLHPLVRLVSLERSRSDFGKHYPRPAYALDWEKRYFLGEPWTYAAEDQQA